MRTAFEALGASVVAVDDSDAAAVRNELERAWSDGVDFVYERYALGCTTGAEFARSKGIPHIVEVNAPLAEEAARYRSVTTQREVLEGESTIFRGATAVIAVSSAVADYVAKSAGVGVTIDIQPNGVDTSLFRPRTDDELRDELGLRSSFVLGFHGRLRPWHNFPFLVDACEHLIARGAPIHLLLIGEGDFAADIGDRIPAERVTSCGWIDHDEIGSYVAAMDVLPLTYDPAQPCYFSPLKLAEAMACGVVPVVPSMGDLTDVVVHGDNGLVYQPGDAADFVTALERLLADSDLVRRLSTAATQAAEQHSWKKVAAAVLEHASGVAPR